MNTAGLKNLQSKRARRNIKISKTSDTTNGIPSLLWNGVGSDMATVNKVVNLPKVKQVIQTGNNMQYKAKQKDDYIVVSFTSWIKRIHNCAHIVDLMKNQTLKPDKIILNLSSDEFVNKENDLPQELIDRIDDVFEIYWIKENTKVYKKIIPTLERFPNDIVISIDDDIEYPDYYVEVLYKGFVENGKKYPICAYKNKKEGDVFCHSGPFTLTKSEFYGTYLKELYNNIVLTHGINIISASDDVYFYAALLNGVLYKTLDQNILDKTKNLYRNSSKKNDVNYSLYDKNWHTMYANEVNIIRDYIQNTYKKSYKDLISSITKEHVPLTVVTMTSWTKRIKYVSGVIKNFFNTQTIKPDVFYLWLSLEEFPNKENDLPKDLVGVCHEFNVKIKWLPYNDRNFKRWYVYPMHYNDLVISIDDDITIDKDLVKEAKKHINEENVIYNIFKNLTTYYSYPKADKFITRQNLQYSLNYIWLGCSVVCPKTFPLEAITEKNNSIRRTICKRCDESWLDPFRIKNGIRVSYLNFYYTKNHESPIQKDATWRILSKKVGKYSVRLYQLYVCLKKFPENMNKFKELYPEYNTSYFDNLGVDYIIKNILNE